MLDITMLTAKELVVFFNKVNEGQDGFTPVKRFASLEAGQKRVNKFLDGIYNTTFASSEDQEFVEDTFVELFDRPAVHVTQKVEDKVVEAPVTPKAEEKAEEAPKKEKKVNAAVNAEGVKKSWEDDAVRAKRTQRSGVRVTPKKGKPQEFKSVREAYDQLGLDLKGHIKFRAELKAEKVINLEDGTKWEIVPLNY